MTVRDDILAGTKVDITRLERYVYEGLSVGTIP